MQHSKITVTLILIISMFLMHTISCPLNCKICNSNKTSDSCFVCNDGY